LDLHGARAPSRAGAVIARTPARPADVVTRQPYEVRIRGLIGPAARQAFAGFGVVVEPPVTVLAGDLDQVELHALLERVRALGLELIEIMRPSSGAAPGP